jgi:transcriptional regulator with XRE-family HTH domain
LTEEPSPTLRRWELGKELRRIRESQGKTIEEVAQDLSEQYATGFSASKISRLELARRGANPRDVRDLCEYYGVDAARRDRLIGLAKAMRADNRSQTGSLAYQEYVALEQLARSVRTYEPMFVPGLLQTLAYQRAVIDSCALPGLGPESAEHGHEQLVRIRLARQKRLDGPASLLVRAVIDQNVLQRLVGSNEVMAEQVAHLARLSAYPNIVVRVVPKSRGLYPGCESAGFSMLEYEASEPTRDNVTLVEGLVDAVWVERAADRLRISRIFEHLEGIALGVEESRDLIAAAARRFV